MNFEANSEVNQLIVNDSHQRTAAVDGLSEIAVLIYRFAEVERLYLRDQTGAETTALEAEVVKLYRTILEYQIRIICQLDRNNAHQFARNVVEADNWRGYLEKIRACEAACKDYMALLDTTERLHGMQRLENRLRDVDSEIQQRFDTLIDELETSRKEQEDSNMSKVESECLHTLRTLDYESDKSRIAERVPGTCQWFLSHEKYQSWLNETHSQLLWVTADPGCGKSVLSKFLINSYAENAPTGTPSICYFFFRAGSEKNQDATNALCAILHQLFKQKQALLRHALPEFKINGTKLSGLIETLWGIFLNVAADSEAGGLICILDALDECGGTTRTSLIRKLLRFFSDPPASANVKFIITSRPNTTIENGFLEEGPSVSSFKLMGEGESEMAIIQREISLVIDMLVERFRNKRQQCKIYDEAHHAISDKLAQIENRTYLWVSLIFPELDKNVRSSENALLHLIKAIPTTLQEAYERILSSSTDMAKAKKLLHFVLAAQRPFTLEEMNIAMATTKDCTSVDDLELEPEATFHETVRELCGLFISVSDSKVYLIHQTAREFLLAPNLEGQLVPESRKSWMYSMNLRTSHLELAKTCLQYLHLSGLEDQSQTGAIIDYSKQARKHADLTQRRAFRSYSATVWCFHASESDHEAVCSLMNLMLSITSSRSQAFETWMEFRLRNDQRGPQPSMISQKCADLDQLSLAACFGIAPLVRSLLMKIQHPTDHKSVIQRAAVYAIKYCPDLFYLFLDRGLDVDAPIEDGGSFLHEAARFGRVNVAQLLIKAGSRVNSEDSNLREPLFYAVQQNHSTMISLMIENGACIGHTDVSGQSALYQAIWFSQPTMTRYLLEQGADCNLKDHLGRSPLLHAVRSSYRKGCSNIELLLKYGAEVDSSDCEGNTALSYAAQISDKDASVLLIRHGAQLDSKDQYGRTPLSHAAERLEDRVSALLIKNGAQIDTKCNEMRTPLSYAAKAGSILNIKCLTKNGAEVNSSDWKCNTPLIYAAQNNFFKGKPYKNIEMIRDRVDTLLNQGAKPITVNESGHSPSLILERSKSKPDSHLPEEQIEEIKADIRALKLRLHGAKEVKLPTSSDTLSQVVAHLTVNLINIVNNSTEKATKDYQIAVKTSNQLFCQWKLHPIVSSITLQDDRTIEQEIIKFVLAHEGQDYENIAYSQSCLEEQPSQAPTQSDETAPSPLHELELPKPKALERLHRYGGLVLSQKSENCSFYLHRLAELQQRLFNVNECLYYLESNPDNCSETIDDLIFEATGQESNRFIAPESKIDSLMDT